MNNKKTLRFILTVWMLGTVLLGALALGGCIIDPGGDRGGDRGGDHGDDHGGPPPGDHGGDHGGDQNQH